MADQYSLCLLTVMDRLWYHEIILFPPSDSSSSTIQIPKTLDSTLQQEQTSSLPQEKPITHHHSKNEEEEEEERPTTRNRRSHSSSTVERRLPRNMSRSSSMRALEIYSMSCRSLRSELEMEEVQGFIDLGFDFNKLQNISPKLSSLVPGLKLLESSSLSSSSSLDSDKKSNEDENEDEDSDIVRDEEEDGEDEGIMRPYLSEAWLIKKPNSPLLNLKLPRGNSDDSDMKKHLKFWARTVATVIHQKC